MNQDGIFLQAAVKELQEYLTSPVLHWPMSKGRAGSNLPRLTVGNLRLALMRAGADPELQNSPEFKTIQETVERVHDRWRSNWAKKAEQEFTERLRLWKDFVTVELVAEGFTSDYRNQVRLRTVLELLKDDILREDPVEMERLSRLDEEVKFSSREGNFIWDENLQIAFPKDRFWFLYRK